jgi:hypothetical protein
LNAIARVLAAPRTMRNGASGSGPASANLLAGVAANGRKDKETFMGP